MRLAPRPPRPASRLPCRSWRSGSFRTCRPGSFRHRRAGEAAVDNGGGRGPPEAVIRRFPRLSGSFGTSLALHLPEFPPCRAAGRGRGVRLQPGAAATGDGRAWPGGSPSSGGRMMILSSGPPSIKGRATGVPGLARQGTARGRLSVASGGALPRRSCHPMGWLPDQSCRPGGGRAGVADGGATEHGDETGGRPVDGSTGRRVRCPGSACRRRHRAISTPHRRDMFLVSE
jgi:hypothetical protein